MKKKRKQCGRRVRRTVTHDDYMRRAIAQARRNVRKPEGGPFGACIVKNGSILALARNTVLTGDATCHAEINAIRRASVRIGSYDLTGCVIFSTTEPCPMCFSAIHWARIGHIVYGTRMQDAARAGFNELNISDRRLATLGGVSVTLTPGVMRDECQRLFDEWRRTYPDLIY